MTVTGLSKTSDVFTFHQPAMSDQVVVLPPRPLRITDALKVAGTERMRSNPAPRITTFFVTVVFGITHTLCTHV
jgi:hypothetical protein